MAAWEQLQLPAVDPTAVWVIVGDLARLDEWAPTEGTTWRGDLPGTGERFASTMLVLWRRHRLRAEVAAWEAGRRFRLRLDGLPLSGVAEIECRVESVIESGRAGTTVAIGYGAVVNRWLAASIRWGAERRMRAALSRLHRRVAGRTAA